MNERLRRHARLIAGALALVLLAGGAYVLRSAGSARAQAARVAAQAARAAAGVQPIAPVLAPPAQRGRTRAPSGNAASRRARLRAVPPGVPTPPPSRRDVSAGLRRLTGLSPAQVIARPVCSRPTPGHAACAAQTLVLRSNGAVVRPQVSRYRSLGSVKLAASTAQPASPAAASPPQAATPAYLQEAYDLTYLSQSGGTHDTIAVVDAYDDPTAGNDLAFYRSYYGLPACTASSGCFRKVGQTGTSSLPRSDVSWQQEIALDLDAVSAICPQCHILLVEANSNSFADLQAAMQTAVSKGANQISASWWGVSSSVPSGFSTFSEVATVAATGDAGYAGSGMDNYPAALPGVTAAGGTTLAPAATPSARGFGEAAWSWNGANGGGSGCDLQFARPYYQPAAGCAGRAYADLSADADPSTGLSVYDRGSWSLVGGTSLSTPLIAAYYAITGVAGATPAWAYDNSGTLNDVLSGSSGNCAPTLAYICDAGAGYDGPTGVGSITGSVTAGAPGIGGPSVSSSSAPTYTAGVTAHGATITGGIYRNRLDTQWWIEYGTSTAYGHQTPATDIGVGTAPVSITGNVSGLTAGTTYHYRLVAENSLGTTYGFDYTLTTQPAPAGGPTASFAVSPGTPSPGASATFDASASSAGTIGSISDYSWNFGDGTGVQDAGGSSTTSHIFASRGTYVVTLTVTSNGRTDTSTQTVTVDNPAARFTPASSSVPAGTTIALNAGGSTAGTGGAITDYSWNFGDGTGAVDAGTNAIQSHAFPTPGTYTVTLTTTDDLNVTGTATAQITVAAFTAAPALPAPGDTVTFAPVNLTPGSTYVWDFGDGTQPHSTSNASSTHAYDKRGAYSVSLTVQAPDGANSSRATATVIVDTAPRAQFTPSSAAIPPGTDVGLDAAGSNASAGGSITDYSWNFGDGTPTQDTAGSAVANHTFEANGIYTVTLTTTDDLGATSSASQQLTVDQPIPVFEFSPLSAAPATPVSFDASATSDPESALTDYTWDFGDGTPVQDAQTSVGITHSFAAAGTYTVKLTVTDQLELSASTSEQLVISPAVTQSSSQTTPTPTTSTPTSTPPGTPTTPTSPGPPRGVRQPFSLALQLIGTGHQRLTRVLAHGLRLALIANQRIRASFQLTVPLSETKHSVPAGRHNPKAPVVLQRLTQTLAAGKHTITLKLSRAAVRRLSFGGSLVVTVRISLRAADGTIVTRTVKATLTR